MSEKKRNSYIDAINYYQDILRIVRDYNYDFQCISEYDSVYQDILDYQENDFEDFKSYADFEGFIDYLKDLIVGGLKIKD